MNSILYKLILMSRRWYTCQEDHHVLIITQVIHAVTMEMVAIHVILAIPATHATVVIIVTTIGVAIAVAIVAVVGDMLHYYGYYYLAAVVGRTIVKKGANLAPFLQFIGKFRISKPLSVVNRVYVYFL